MTTRRALLLTMTSGFVALAVLAAPVIADELLGVLTKVDVEGKALTVVEKDTDKEIKVTVNDQTEVTTKQGPAKVDRESLEKISKRLERAKEKGAKGLPVNVTHEKGVASKIKFARKKAVEKAAGKTLND
jgi:hypothetical protein